MKREVLPTCLRPAYGVALYFALVLGAWVGAAVGTIALVDYFDPPAHHAAPTPRPQPSVFNTTSNGLLYPDHDDVIFNVSASAGTKVLEVMPSQTVITGDLVVHGRIITDAATKLQEIKDALK